PAEPGWLVIYPGYKSTVAATPIIAWGVKWGECSYAITPNRSLNEDFLGEGDDLGTDYEEVLYVATGRALGEPNRVLYACNAGGDEIDGINTVAEAKGWLMRRLTAKTAKAA
ncbi:MAG: hypothetical protein K0R61_3331, partial [Microvirga sp.]|nr:hypothetical protein [Microvirga sp.]